MDRTSAYFMIFVVVLLLLYLVYFIFSNYVSIPFSTFKSNYLGAPEVGIVLGYSDIAQYSASLQCALTMMQVIANARAVHSWNTTSIDFFVVNQTSCTYQKGLGYANPINATSGECLALANAEPTIFLNYSYSNYTRILPSRLYVGGDAGFMQACPIAAEFS